MDILTEANIRQRVADQVFQRGEDYYADSAVSSVVRRGDMVHAEVQGSEYSPYRVVVSSSDGEVQARCSCPYGAEWGGWCKHIVATLLTLARDRDHVATQPSLDDLLRDLDRDQLRSLLDHLVEAEPRLYDVIAGHLAVMAARATASATGNAPRVSVDTHAVRSQVRDVMRSLDGMRASEAYWYVGGVVEGVQQILDQAQALIDADDGRSALAVLEAITDEYIRGWTYLDDSNGEAGGFFSDLSAVWTEAVLTAELSLREREEWAETLEEWNREVSQYGDIGFAPAIEALNQGWDYPSLVRVLQGEIPDPDAGEYGLPGFADELTDARINVLECRGRLEEALRLAEATRHTPRYLALLAKLGRIDEAVDFGLRHLDDPDQALGFAQVLLAEGEVRQALRVAEHGLTLQGFHRSHLAAWLRDFAAEQGDTALALRAAKVAFAEAPDLDSYQRAEELAGESWPEVREALLEQLRSREYGYKRTGVIEVLLYEGLVGDALDVVEGSWDYELIGRVADAAAESHPDRVIPICRAQADGIMDAGKASAYDKAVRWLRRARTAYRVANREAEWIEYLDDLLTRHHKKYKLRPMLEALRDR